MQKALLVLTLVGASFAGGAVVNGPGLAWVRDMVGLTPPKLNPASPAATVAMEPVSELPTFDLVGKPPGGESGLSLVQPQPQQPAAPATPTRQAAGTVQAKASVAKDWGLNHPPPLEPPALSAHGVANSGSAVTEPPAPGSAEAARDELLRRSSAAQGAGGGRPEPSQPLAPLPITTAGAGMGVGVSSAQGGSTWADVVKKLKAQGVSRFWIEGEPGQAVRFRCAVPVPGHASISQQFEAESSDVVTAAESVLRRIVAWRVSENP